MKRFKIELFVAIFFIVAIMVFSSSVRYEQLRSWEQNHPEYFVDDTVSLTTLDGYYWVRLAKMYNPSIDSNLPDTYRGYPDYPYTLKKETDNLLVFLINKLTPVKGNYYLTGVFIVIVLASLFIIPLFLYFKNVAGLSTAIAATTLTTFGYSYYYRTFLGRVDTDCLNLFFPFMLSYLIYLIPRLKSYRAYIAATFMGVVAYLYMWWYPYPGFLLIFAVIMFIYLLLKKVSIVKSLIYTVLFVVFSDPRYMLSSLDSIRYFIFGSKYFAGNALIEHNINWPNIAEFISETQQQSFDTILLYAGGSTATGIIGLVGIFLLIGKIRKDFLPVLPIFLLGLISFKSGNRFTMYLSPFLYAGIGYIAYLLAYYFFKYVAKLFEEHLKFFTEVTSTILSVFTVVFMLIYFSGIDYKPLPSVPIPIQRSAIELKKVVGGHPVVFTWWDFGYMYQDLGGFSTFHDGGIQGKARGYFVGLGLTSDSQEMLYRIISYFDHNGFSMFEQNKITDVKGILSQIQQFDKPVKNMEIYIIVSYDMVYKYDGMDFFGKWDFAKETSNYSDYEKVDCNVKGEKITCDGEPINTDEGVWGDEQLSRIIIFDENGIKKEISYEGEGRILEIILYRGNMFMSVLLDRDIFNSNFNQLYFFGKYDNKLFEKIYDKFPVMRVYKLRG
jgi:dolichyl-diphosphooligosaccharide--protein glycosyltransferase